MIIDQNLVLSLIVGAFVGLTSGYLGSIMVLRRMALVGDALSHVALPGIGIALTFNLNPFLGAFTALIVGVLLVWSIEKRTSTPTEAAVGLIFTSSLAIGLLITPAPELLEALFGDIAKVQPLDGVLSVVFSILVLLAAYLIRSPLVLSLISPDLAKSQGIKTDWINLLFLILVSIVVALGVKVVGTLLMGALVIIPAVAAKGLARSLNMYGVLSAAFGLAIAVAGVTIAAVFGLAPGPVVVLVGVTVFLITAILRK